MSTPSLDDGPQFTREETLACAQVILDQIGRADRWAIGCREAVAMPEDSLPSPGRAGVQFRVNRAMEWVTVTLSWDDTYAIEYKRVRRAPRTGIPRTTILATADGVYCDMLGDTLYLMTQVHHSGVAL